MVDLDKLRADRQKCIEWKNIKPRWEAIKKLPIIDNIGFNLGRIQVEIFSNWYILDQGLSKIFYYGQRF